MRYFSKNTIKEFTTFLIPSVIGSISIAALIIIDGIFIGRGIGGKGLASLSTAVPVFTLYAALGLLIGMGGATVTSILKGQGKFKERNQIFTLSIFMALSIGIVITIFQGIFIDFFTRFLGAPANLFNFVRSYIRILGIFATFYILAQTITCFVRNDNNPKLAMIGMAVSGAMNITLDYLFIIVFQWGMMGAALATCISQLGFIATLLLHFFSEKNTLKLEFNCYSLDNVKRIIKTGFPTFLTDISNGVVIFAFNMTFYRLVGEVGVSSYGIILNFNYLIFLSYIGIAQAAQPMFSLSYGKGDIKKVMEILKLALLIGTILSLITIIGVNIYKLNIINVYNNETDIVKFASEGMPLFFSGTLFMGINIILASFFQAVEYSSIASVITFSRGVVFIVIGLNTLPLFLGVKGVWLVILFAEGVTFISFAAYYLIKNIRLKEVAV